MYSLYTQNFYLRVFHYPFQFIHYYIINSDLNKLKFQVNLWLILVWPAAKCLKWFHLKAIK